MARRAFAADDEAVQRYFGRLALPVRVVARQLDALVRDEMPDARAGIKWGVPFYARAAPVCYVSGARAHVTFGFARGASIPDASGLLLGTGRSPIRKATLPAGAPVPEAHVRAWLRHARRLDERA